MKASITISRRQGRKDSGDDIIHLTVGDESSRLRVCQVEIPLDWFMKALTGLADVGGDMTHVVCQDDIHKLGKEVITERVYCNKVDSYTESDQRCEVSRHFDQHYAKDGWELFSDGTTTQQPGKNHVYLIRRWE